MGWLKHMIAQGEFITLPGVYDGLTAQLAAAAGHKALYCSGFVAAAIHGLPDLGVLDASDMRGHFARIARACDLPMLVDGDAGYGGVLNVHHTVQLLGAVGVKAVHIEDQALPKRCGHLEGKRIVSFDDACARIAAAVEAGLEAGVEIVARTDALNVTGLDEVKKRAKAFYELGASMIFVDGVKDPDLICTLPEQIKAPLLFNAARFEGSHSHSPTALENMGYKAAIFPGDVLCAAVSAARDRLMALKDPGYVPVLDAITLDGINKITGQAEALEKERRFLSDG